MHRHKNAINKPETLRLNLGRSSLTTVQRTESCTEQHSVNRFVNQKIYCVLFIVAWTVFDTVRPISAECARWIRRNCSRGSSEFQWIERFRQNHLGAKNLQTGRYEAGALRKFSAPFAARFQGEAFFTAKELQLKLIWPLNNVKLVTWKEANFRGKTFLLDGLSLTVE